MLERAVASMRAACDEVVVVLPPDGGPPAPAGVLVARDAASFEGPLAGVHAGLVAATRDVAVVAGGDMPELRPAVLEAMLRRLRDGPAPAVALLEGARVRPLPCAVRVAAARDAARALLAAGRRRLRDLLADLDVDGIDERTWRALDPTGGTLLDVDAPGDLSR
jgi:molybdopterin-guanine dinucleotide biosynthesis protein A